MSYLWFILKKYPIFAARIRENNNIKTRYSNEKNISTLEQKEKNKHGFREKWLQQTAVEYWQHRRAKGRKKLTVSDEYNGVKA